MIPQANQIYRHFKGNYYFIQDVALDSETKERIVVYRPIYDRNDSQIGVRRESMFLEEIDQKRKDNITGQKYRFVMVEELSKDLTK